MNTLLTFRKGRLFSAPVHREPGMEAISHLSGKIHTSEHLASGMSPLNHNALTTFNTFFVYSIEKKKKVVKNNIIRIKGNRKKVWCTGVDKADSLPQSGKGVQP